MVSEFIHRMLNIKNKNKNNTLQTVLCHMVHVCLKIEPVHEISNNVVCETGKASVQPSHTRSLIRAFACRLNVL